MRRPLVSNAPGTEPANHNNPTPSTEVKSGIADLINSLKDHEEESTEPDQAES